MPPFRARLKNTHGCLSCRARGKKCSYNKPKCNDCVRLGLPCQWPDGTTPQPVLKRKNRRGQSQWAISLPANDQGPEAVMVKEPMTDDRSTEFMVNYYINCLFRRSNASTETYPDTFSPSAAGRFPTFFVTSESSVGYDCLSACACNAFARIRNMDELRLDSVVRYIQCLRKVNKLLGDPSYQYEPETIFCVTFLALFEITNPTSSYAWRDHTLGAGRLIQDQGPRAFDRLPRRVLLERLRWPLVVASLSLNKATFLSRPCWKTVPWASCSDKGCSQTLLDIMVDIPGCMEELTKVQNAVRDHGAQVRHAWVEILRKQRAKIYSIFFSLHEWRQRFEQVQEDTSWAWQVNSTHGTGSVFPSSTQFTNFTVATRILYYETALIMACAITIHANSLTQLLGLNSIIEFTHGDVPRPLMQTSHLNASAIPVLGPIQTARSSGLTIASCMDYVPTCSAPPNGSIPLVVAYHALGVERTPQGRWVARVLELICSQSGGAYLIQHLMQTTTAGWGSMLRPLAESWD